MIENFARYRDRWRYLHDAYRGGRYWSDPSSQELGHARLSWFSIDESGREVWRSGMARSYLVPHRGETEEAFARRRDLAVYLNVCAPIVKAYSEGVSSRVIRDLGALQPLLIDADRRGRHWSELVESVSIWAAVYGACAVAVDAPRTIPEALSEARRAELGLQPYCAVIHPTAWAWARSEAGRLTEFAYAESAENREVVLNRVASAELKA